MNQFAKPNEPETLDAFCDGMQILGISPFGVSVVFMRTMPRDPNAPKYPPGQAPPLQYEEMAVIRFTVEHFKAVIWSMWHNMVEAQKAQKLIYPMHPDILKNLNADPVAWRKFWGEEIGDGKVPDNQAAVSGQPQAASPAPN